MENTTRATGYGVLELHCFPLTVSKLRRPATPYRLGLTSNKSTSSVHTAPPKSIPSFSSYDIYHISFRHISVSKGALKAGGGGLQAGSPSQTHKTEI
jgi:hypothetical protein